MKKFAFIAAVVLTTLSIQSCRQPDETMSNDEMITLQRVQAAKKDSVKLIKPFTTIIQTTDAATLEADGEIAHPPKK